MKFAKKTLAVPFVIASADALKNSLTTSDLTSTAGKAAMTVTYDDFV